MALWLEVHEGGRVRTHEIAGARLTIGRGSDNEVVLDDPRSSRHHCRVEKTPQGVLLEDLESRNGTILKGYAVKKSILQVGDEFRIGSVRCFLREGERVPTSAAAPPALPEVPEPEAAAPPAQTPSEASRAGGAAEGPPAASVAVPASLEALAGPHAGTKIRIEKTPFVLGRSREADFQLEDRRASGLHARIVYDGKVFRIEDLRSTNGTFLAKRPIERAILVPGAILQIGASTFRVQVPPVSEAALAGEPEAEDFVEFDAERFVARSRAEHPAVVAALVLILAVLGYFAIDLARRAASRRDPDRPDPANLVGAAWSFEAGPPSVAAKAAPGAVPGWELACWAPPSGPSEASGDCGRLEPTSDYAKPPGSRALRVSGDRAGAVVLAGRAVASGLRAGTAYRLEGWVVNESAQAAGLVVEWLREARGSAVVLGRSFSEAARSPRESTDVDQVVWSPPGTLAARVSCCAIGGSAVFDRISLSEHREAPPSAGEEARPEAADGGSFPWARGVFSVPGAAASKNPLVLVAAHDGTFSLERPPRQALALGMWAGLPPEKDPHGIGSRASSTRALARDRGSLTYVTDLIDVQGGGWVPVECKVVSGLKDVSLRWRSGGGDRGAQSAELAWYLELPEGTTLEVYQEGSAGEAVRDPQAGPLGEVRELVVGHAEDRASFVFSPTVSVRKIPHPFDPTRALFAGETGGVELEVSLSRKSRLRSQAAVAAVREAERLFEEGRVAEAFRSLAAIPKRYPEEDEAARLSEERLGEWRRVLREEWERLCADEEELRATRSAVLHRLLQTRIQTFLARYSGVPEAREAEALREKIEESWRSLARAEREERLERLYELGKRHFARDDLYVAERYLRWVSEESPESEMGREAKSILSRIGARLESRRSILLK